jgi:hypothetical protein
MGNRLGVPIHPKRIPRHQVDQATGYGTKRMTRDEKYEWVSKTFGITIPEERQEFISDCINYFIPLGLIFIVVAACIFFYWDILLLGIGSTILGWVVFVLVMWLWEKLGLG